MSSHGSIHSNSNPGSGKLSSSSSRTLGGSSTWANSSISSFERRARCSVSKEFRWSLVETDSEATQRDNKVRETFSLTSLRHDKVGFYGRAQQMAQLEQSLDRLVSTAPPSSRTTSDNHNENVAATATAATPSSSSSSSSPPRKTELVLIAGGSGTGKSTLAQKLQTKLPRGSIMVKGKCDYNNRDEPFCCIADACETLCQKMITFLLLDDLQWSDIASLELIQALLTDTDHNQLLIIGCYRDNQVHEHETLASTLTTLRGLTDMVHITEIELHNLTVDDCNLILMDLFNTDESTKTQPLAAICHKRTLGNVNFLLQYTAMLQETRLVDFNLGLMQWEWDVSTIEGETHAADNVIVVVERRMAQLSTELRHFLSVASSIGATTTRRILELAWNSVSTTTNGDNSCECLLEKAVACNFLEPCGDDKYKFVHDKIQESARKLFSEEEIRKEQFAIGMCLLKELKEGEKGAEVFLIRDLVFLIRDLLDNNDDPSEAEAETIIQVNLLASQRARSLSAFKSSLVYAMKAISLLTDKSWKDSHHRDRTLQLYNLACESAEFTGEFDLMEELCKTVLEIPDCTLLDKLRIYKVKMDRMANDGDPQKLKNATQLCIKLLKELGCSVPWGPRVPVSVISSLLHFKNNVPTEATLRALPKLVDTKKVECMHLLYRLQGYAYFQREIMLSTWAALRVVSMTLQDGRNEISSTAFPGIAMAMTGLFGEFQKGEIYCMHGLTLVDMEDNKVKEGRTLFTAAIPFVYTRPVNIVGKPLTHGYKSAMQAGDTESAMFCLSHKCWIDYMRGKSLHYLEADCHKYLAQAKQLQRLVAVFFLAPLAEMITRLTDSKLGIDFYLENKTSDLFTDHRDVAHTVSHAYFGKYREGADLYIRLGKTYDSKYPAMPIGMWTKFLAGVCMYDTAINTGQRKYRTHANKVRSTIRSWCKKGNPNSNHHASLLDAEFYRMTKKSSEASKCYEKAASLAGRTGLLHDAALVQERYAIHILASELGTLEEATYHMSKAVSLYSEWGANAKVDSLKARYCDLLSTDNAHSPFK